MSLAPSYRLLNVDPPLSDAAPILWPDSAVRDGYLWVIEPGFSTAAAPVSGAVPTADQVCDNIAEVAACRTMGIAFADRATVRPIFKIKSDNSGKFALERTPKGGLHGIISQTTDTINTGAHFLLPEAIEDWLIANSQTQTNSPTTGHRFAWFESRRVTRAGIVTGLGQSLRHRMIAWSSGDMLAGGAYSESAGFGSGLRTSTVSAVVPNSSSAYLEPSAQPLGVPSFRGVYANSWQTATKPTTAQLTVAHGWGTMGPQVNAVFTHFAASYVLYRSTGIDLTAAGLSFYDAYQLEWRRHLEMHSPVGTVIPAITYVQHGVTIYEPAYVLRENGAYYNDLPPTDPATIP